ncbi:hypothetical protein LFM09_07585 [Lentzea alba]|uniref:hypothetical protein n=1 Tax=Lentzea alba TaxID=2714351 RepID=UPI0039BF0847
MSRRFALTLLVMTLLAGCAATEPGAPVKPALDVIKLEVTGTATISSLELTVDGKTTEERSVTLPWNRDLEFPQESGPHEWKLVLHHGGGSVLAKSFANGEPLTQSSGSSSGGTNSTAQLSGSIKG